MSKIFKNLTALALAITPFLASAQDLTPEILFPNPSGAALLYGLSDNGEWGVAPTAPEADGFSDFVGASIYDLRSNPVKSTNIGKGYSFVGAFDVTDDGTMVAGTVDRLPGICRLENNKWVWHTLPVSNKDTTVVNVFTDYERTYRFDGGEIANITPDGKYAVGMCRSTEYEQLEHGYMWDLTDFNNPKIVDLPRAMWASRLIEISADGRYVRNRTSVWDRQTNQVKRVPVDMDIYAQAMSTNGMYFAGVNEDRDIPFATWWDVANNKVTILDDDIYADAVAWNITNEGLPLIARPFFTPYADGYIYHDNFLYSFKDLYEQVYGMNLRRYGIDNTGKPFQVSADGRTIVMMHGYHECYVVRFKEDLQDALNRIDLFANWTSSPTNNSKITQLGKITLNFANPIEIVNNSNAYQNIKLLDSNGNQVATALSNNGLVKSGSAKIDISFRTRGLNENESYTVVVGPGVIHIKNKPESTNPEIRINYTGRGDHPVKPVSVSPADGSTLATLSLSDNPVSVRFDTDIMVNSTSEADRPVVKIYIDEETEPVAWANMDVDLNTSKDLIIFPSNDLPLYKGSTYKLVVPANSVTDMSGAGGCEEFSISYVGSYIPELGDEKYLFHSTCDNYDNFLFYEGDHGEPTAEYAEMNFTADETPWAVVLESETSTDNAFGSHSCYVDGRASDDWVTTRQIIVPEGIDTYLEFDSQSYRRSKQDYLKVYIYEYPGILNSLNKSRVDDIKAHGDLVYNELQSPGATEDLLAGEWTHNVIDLAPYAGKSIYICFVNDNQNQSMVMIDNIEVIRSVKAFVTIRNKENVVNESEMKISGMVTVADPTASYSTLKMELKDMAGNMVSTINESGLTLTDGETYAFEFPKALTLDYGVENQYTIDYTLDNDPLSYSGVVRNLTFEPVKRVAIEEFTGRDCQFCPGGIITLESLESTYGSLIVPIALHCYNGTDPKGANVMDYWEFTGIGGAPMARINRGPSSSPLWQTPAGKYVDEGSAYGQMLWKDYVKQELQELALIDLIVEDDLSGAGNTLNYVAKVKSALNMDGSKIRVFAVLLEDGLRDRQANAYSSSDDPIFGEWGLGGRYSSTNSMYTFNNVARGIWGTSFIGKSGLLPASLSANQEYEVNIDMPIPSIVANRDNCKIAVLLIDESTGRVVNSCMSGTEANGIDDIETDVDADVEPVYYTLQGVRVQNPDRGIYIKVVGNKAYKVKL